MRVGTFNVGCEQSRLECKTKPNPAIIDMQRIIRTCVVYGDLDIFSMCEVGGHHQGLNVDLNS